MTAIPAAYVLGGPSFPLVYGPEQHSAISRLCGRSPVYVETGELEERRAELAQAEIVFSGWGAPVMDEHFLAAVPRLRLVLYGAGAVRGFVTDALVERGIRVSSAAAANAVPVAEYTLAVITLSLKRVWRFLGAAPDPARLHSVPGGYGSTVGLVAVGEIGRLVLDGLRRTDVRILAHDPYLEQADAEAPGVELVGLDELFHRSDVVSLHVPLHDGTRGMIAEELLRSMKEGSTLINTARGGLLDPVALVDVLRDRPDLQAVLDVTEPEPLPPSSPLRSLPNVVVTPHLAGSLGAECRRMGDFVVEELRRHLAGKPLRGEVDLSRLDRLPLP